MPDRAMGYLDLAKACDNFPYDKNSQAQYYALYLPNDAQPHGYLLPEIVRKMPWTTDFHVSHAHPRKVLVLDSSNGKSTAQAVTAAFTKLVAICIDRHLFHVLDGRHSEPFAILGASCPISIERFASSLFGITACGAHLVAYVGMGSEMKIWIGKRAAHLYSYPGYLDTTVGGGVKADTSPFDTIVHEADEEASLPADFVRAHAQPCGVLTCMDIMGNDWPGEKGLVLPDVLYVHDLRLPEEMRPTPKDDEVEDFRCLTIDEVQAALLAGQFKPDPAIVLIDFFMRHGIITPENESDYVDIVTHLHRKLPFPIKSRREMHRHRPVQ